MPFKDKKRKALYDAAYRSKNKEKRAAQHAEWWSKNKEKVAARKAKLDALMRQNPDYHKRCTRCEEVKPIEEFYRTYSRCKKCHNAIVAGWQAENQEKCREIGKHWYRNNKERVRARHRTDKSRAVRAIWIKNNPDKRKAILKKNYLKKMGTTRGVLDGRMSAAIWHAIRQVKAGRKWESLVGYTVHDLRKHIEKQFKKHPGMSWENINKWHIDHKIPKAAFHYETPEDIDFKRCWALKNLQPLWSVENLKKGAKVDKPFQPSLSIAL